MQGEQLDDIEKAADITARRFANIEKEVVRLRAHVQTLNNPAQQPPPLHASLDTMDTHATGAQQPPPLHASLDTMDTHATGLSWIWRCLFLMVSAPSNFAHLTFVYNHIVNGYGDALYPQFALCYWPLGAGAIVLFVFSAPLEQGWRGKATMAMFFSWGVFSSMASGYSIIVRGNKFGFVICLCSLFVVTPTTFFFHR